jgi:proline iminopeptidase
MQETSSPLFPSIEPYNSGRLQVSPLHEIYYEECGNPDGVPILFLHGGPGGGLHKEYRQFFDPKHYHIVLFDQRGAGQSTPSAEVEENTTWDLVHDIELVRKHLGIRNWIVFGGSWGSTLALSYAVTHPEKPLGLILRGIFLCRPSELQWFYQKGADEIFPDEWEKYLDIIPEAERADLIAAYHRRLFGEDEAVRLEAARAWSKWEVSTSRLFRKESAIKEFEDPKLALAFARIENHYFTNNAFFQTDNFLLENMGKIRHIPGIIVQGRYDVVCPMRSAWDLHRAWPEAELVIVPDAGHSALEAGISRELVRATEAFKAIKYEY